MADDGRGMGVSSTIYTNFIWRVILESWRQKLNYFI